MAVSTEAVVGKKASLKVNIEHPGPGELSETGMVFLICFMLGEKTLTSDGYELNFSKNILLRRVKFGIWLKRHRKI